MPFLLALLLALAPLVQARADLQKGKLVEVLTGLRPEDRTLPPGERPAAARLLADAAQRALAAQRRELALQLAEASFALDAAQPRILELLGGWALEDGHFAQARRYGEFWSGVAPGDEKARTFRARIASEEAKAGSLSAKAKSLGKQVAGLFSRAKDPDASGPRSTPSNALVIYGTSWCPACRTARRWMKEQNLAFEDKDLERDEAARRELERKERDAGSHHRGVPVIDVHGTLLEGFDSQRIEELLKG